MSIVDIDMSRIVQSGRGDSFSPPPWIGQTSFQACVSNCFIAQHQYQPSACPQCSVGVHENPGMYQVASSCLLCLVHVTGCNLLPRPLAQCLSKQVSMLHPTHFGTYQLGLLRLGQLLPLR